MSFLRGQHAKLTRPAPVSALPNRVITMVVAEGHVGRPASGELLRYVTDPSRTRNARESFDREDAVTARHDSAVRQGGKIAVREGCRDDHPDPVGNLFHPPPGLLGSNLPLRRRGESRASKRRCERRGQNQVGPAGRGVANKIAA